MLERRYIQTEKQLRRPKTSLEEAINYQTDPVILLERMEEDVLLVTEANSSFLDLIHSSKSFIIGQHLDEVFYHCDELWMKEIRNLTQSPSSGKFETYSKIFNKHFELRYAHTNDDQFLVQFRDISDFKHEQKRNERLTNLYRSLRDISRIARMHSDKKLLLSRAADILVKNQGYYSVNIVLMNSWGKIIDKISSFSEKEVLELKIESLAQLPCLKKLSEGENLLYTLNPAEECQGCPFLETYQNRSAIVTSLKYRDISYGAIIASGEI